MNSHVNSIIKYVHSFNEVTENCESQNVIEVYRKLEKFGRVLGKELKENKISAFNMVKLDLSIDLNKYIEYYNENKPIEVKRKTNEINVVQNVKPLNRTHTNAIKQRKISIYKQEQETLSDIESNDENNTNVLTNIANDPFKRSNYKKHSVNHGKKKKFRNFGRNFGDHKEEEDLSSTSDSESNYNEYKSNRNGKHSLQFTTASKLLNSDKNTNIQSDESLENEDDEEQEPQMLKKKNHLSTSRQISNGFNAPRPISNVPKVNSNENTELDRETRKSGFVPPLKRAPTNTRPSGASVLAAAQHQRQPKGNQTKEDKKGDSGMEKLMDQIRLEVLDTSPGVSWDDIAGLRQTKAAVIECAVWPLLRPDLFTGLRKPPKGLLLFGPPGNGKTMIGKAIASQCEATFFSISASSLMSKWVGEGEKLVRALFAVAREMQPAVIFIDEIDSLLTKRTDKEMEGTRRLKTEFLIQIDGAATSTDDRLLIVGATNRPQDLDEAARRRLSRRLYVPLPDIEARRGIIENLLKKSPNNLSKENMDFIAQQTQGFSGDDMKNLCSEAALIAMREIHDIRSIQTNTLRPITLEDFQISLQVLRPSVDPSEITHYLDFNTQFGYKK
eukprot:TRINITY_DN3065_c1_g1_i3.p1 TRINITY_DN3065_c1_g1~~TRINITY_DN3065_c1_g1_i3.p1  ORF type:complete len:614 (+),score=167.29 TRINITY_DN3065_c1_g1_i3:30-1871(+)